MRHGGKKSRDAEDSNQQLTHRSAPGSEEDGEDYATQTGNFFSGKTSIPVDKSCHAGRLTVAGCDSLLRQFVPCLYLTRERVGYRSTTRSGVCAWLLRKTDSFQHWSQPNS